MLALGLSQMMVLAQMMVLVCIELVYFSDILKSAYCTNALSADILKSAYCTNALSASL